MLHTKMGQAAAVCAVCMQEGPTGQNEEEERVLSYVFLMRDKT